MLIRISGPALVCLEGGDPVENRDLIRRLDGLESRELCSDYLDAELADLGIVGGSVRLHHVGRSEFRVVTEYRSPVRLDESQLSQLIEDTAGQWSDGIGENGFEEIDGLGVIVDVSPLEQSTEIRSEQIDDGQPVGRPNLLAQAARDGNMTLLQAELAAGADLERGLQGHTPLQWAVIYGQCATALELIRQGANVQALDRMGDDLLMLTAASNALSDDDAVRIAAAALQKGARAADADAPKGKFPLAADQLWQLARDREKFKLAALLSQLGPAT